MQGVLDFQYSSFLFMLIITGTLIYLTIKAYYFYYRNITFIYATFLYKSLSFWIFLPYLFTILVSLLVSLIPFECFAMENINLPSLEEDNVALQSAEDGVINGPPSQALQGFADVQNQQDTPTSSNQPPIIPQNSSGYNLYNNPKGYIDTPDGKIHASDYVPANMEIGERYILAAQSLEDRGLLHGAVLNYKEAYNRFELCEQGMNIDLAFSVDTALANKLRLELLDIIQRQETDLGPYIEKARNEVVELNPAETIQTVSTLTRAKSALTETWSDTRFQTALSVAQAPLSALGVVGLKCVVEHYMRNNR